MSRSARLGLFCLAGFVLAELTVYLRAFRDPLPSPMLAWEGPFSLVLLALGAGCLMNDPRARRWGIALMLMAWSVLFLATVPLSAPPTSDYRIEVKKGEKKLTLFKADQEVATFPVVFGPQPEGTKLRQGDGKTPLGEFKVVDKGPSQFHLWLGLNYPTSEDAWRARQEGVLTWVELALLRYQNLNGKVPYGNGPLGGAIGIHGGGAKKNWTLGCVALENADVEKLYEAVPLGTKVEILP